MSDASRAERDAAAAMNEDTAQPSWRVLAGIGMALMALSVVLWVHSNGLSAPAIASVGPAAAVRLVALLLLVLGAAHGVQALRARASQKQPTAPTTRSSHDESGIASLLWVLAGLAALIAAIGLGAGFVLGATCLFVATARAFGQAVGIKSVGIGLALTICVYVFFTRALSLGLPGGPLERLLP